MVTLTVHGVIFGMAFKISEGYLRLRFFFGGGGGRGIFGRAYFRGGGRGWAYYILRYSLVRTCVKSCQFFCMPDQRPGLLLLDQGSEFSVQKMGSLVKKYTLLRSWQVVCFACD